MRLPPQIQRLIRLSASVMLLLTPTVGYAQTIFDQQVTVEIGVIPLLLGIGVIIAALIVEWNGIIKLLTIERQSLYSIESEHPRLPKKREVLIVILLSRALTIFLTQIVLRAYNAPIDFPNIPLSLKN